MSVPTLILVVLCIQDFEGIVSAAYFNPLRTLSKNKIPVNAAFLVTDFGIAITCAVIGSTVVFGGITVNATIATNVSYLLPIVARYTVGRKSFQPATWNLGKSTIYLSLVATFYISFLFALLVLPQLYSVDAVSRIPRASMLLVLALANIEICPDLHRHC
jgi:hypothetical protein